MDISGSHGLPPLRPPLADHDQKLMKVAQELEASFLSEMLKNAGVGKARDAFGGGAGEDHFSTFLVQEYATATVEAGGIGLAESIYRSLIRNQEESA